MATDGRKIGVFGRTNSGKSTRVKALLRDRPRVIVFDVMDEYQEAGLIRCEGADALRRYIAASWHRRAWRAAYIPPVGDLPAALHALCVFLTGIQAGYKDGGRQDGVTLVVEEMDTSYPLAQLPRHLSGAPNLCNRGRHWGVEMIGVSQSPAQVSMTFRQNVSELYVFPLGAEQHRQAMLQLIGSAHRDELAALQQHEYLRYADGEVTRGRNELGK